MDWAIYGALIVGGLAVAGAAAHLTLRVREGWRALKRLRRELAAALGELADRADRTGTIAEQIAKRPELGQSLGRLRLSLARFAVLRQALDEVDDSLTRVTAVYPRK
jgi:hypothetical protein